MRALGPVFRAADDFGVHARQPGASGAIVAEIRTADGFRLRAARWTPDGAARGTVAIFGGRGEFIEKYFEAAFDLLRRGFAVAILDWRGQGGSERPLRDARKGHVDDFARFDRDLDAFVAEVLGPHCPRPWIGLGHSMGAAILLLADARGLRPFERLVLSSPMIAVKGVDHRGPARLALDALAHLGFGGAFVPKSARETFWTRPFEGRLHLRPPALRPHRRPRRVGAEPVSRRSDRRLGVRRLPRDARVRRFAGAVAKPDADDRRLGRRRATHRAAAERFARRSPGASS